MAQLGKELNKFGEKIRFLEFSCQFSKSSHGKYFNYFSTLVFLSLGIVFIQAKSTDLDEKPHFAKVFNCLLLYPFTAFQHRKGNFPFGLCHKELVI